MALVVLVAESHGGMNMDDIFGQFGDILVVPLVVAVGLKAEVSVITKEVTY
jgi:hypothetical protein